jgi:hypothetical protein
VFKNLNKQTAKVEETKLFSKHFPKSREWKAK